MNNKLTLSKLIGITGALLLSINFGYSQSKILSTIQSQQTLYQQWRLLKAQCKEIVALNMGTYSNYIEARLYEDSILQSIVKKHAYQRRDLNELALSVNDTKVKNSFLDNLPTFDDGCSNECALIAHLTNFKQAYNRKLQTWHVLDPLKSNVYGIGIDRAYDELLSFKKPDTVVVAIIDGGLDILHEDLTSVLWHKSGENGRDEDGNGYAGDFHGWNFLGGKGGQCITRETYDYKRLYLQLEGKFKNKSPQRIKKRHKEEYRLWLYAKSKFYEYGTKRFKSQLGYFKRQYHADSLFRSLLGKEKFSIEDLVAFESKKEEIKRVKENFVYEFRRLSCQSNQELLEKYSPQPFEIFLNTLVQAEENPVLKRKSITDDDYTDINDRFYGNGTIMCTEGMGSALLINHGTHVAGIIGAIRNNERGIEGIANAVKIMGIRAVPDGDEYDKDVSLAIRYAVDNGARVINMSFAKDISPNRQWVEDAIRYAARRDVLLVNGAGNGGQNIDSIPMYPTAKYIRGGRKAPNMITVGASGLAKERLISTFSNYGQAVDVFAPGESIFSCVYSNDKNKDGKYGFMSGTSMASPMVAGIAAILRSYYPQLSAKQVKYIIEASVLKIEDPVVRPRKIAAAAKKVPQKKVSMKELCRTGGIVNAYNAVRLAEEMTK